MRSSLAMALAVRASGFALAEAPPDGGYLDTLLETPVHSASKVAQAPSEVPASVTIVTAEEIRLHGYRTLEEVVRTVRGLYASNDRNYAYAGVRGFSRPTDYNNRILLLWNGHALNEDVFSSAYLGTELGYDLSVVERIEIVRGPGSSLWGGSAMLAVVNVVTRTPASVDGIEASLEVGTRGAARGALLCGRETAGGIGFLVHASGLRADGEDLYFPEYDSPEDNGGVAEELDGDGAFALFALLTYRDVTIHGGATSRRKDVPTASYETVFNDPDYDTVDQRSFLEAKLEHSFGLTRHLTARAYVDHTAYWGVFPYDVELRDESQGTWLGAEGQLVWDTHDANRLTLGLEYQDHVTVRYGYEAPDEVRFDAPFSVASAYVEDEWRPVPEVSLVLGTRWDHYSTFGNAISPRAALVYRRTPRATLKVMYGAAFRPPNVFESDYEDPFAGYVANPALDPEQMWTAEIVWEQRFGERLFATAGAYRYRMRDLIDPVLDPETELTQYRNRSQADASGVELEVGAEGGRGIRVTASYAYQWTEDGESDGRLTNSPRHLLRAKISAPLGPHLWAAADLGYETARDTVQATATDPFLLVNVHLATNELTKAKLRLALHVRNLLDESYAYPGGFEHRQAALEQDGREASVRIGARF